ncbi:DUF1294 domain-containing protein [Salipaludibacillus agaradhaerens]|uniref:DUF1294 domain-containing protein n=1 Tax=Salipaludibacillus agaradhaerens TaxID=76935 RepID=UPI00215188C5|nr:DUF1294 domain-containing protein [Salipaludibacillus agaradhaerens]MCR6107544.1 DUF1294 domain-containing protein [Salipaludibacillus agaradhaerens]MCR6119573.1 DUF1294 domain-containing protein [Salipaludibacillus agaradhaerens]UJW58591.1 DUF1294 domain-containing protein [Bacillus sp. A116_S68]
MQIVDISLVIWLLMMNLIGMILMKTDKRRARRNEWRISEARLFLIAALGGAIGMWFTSKIIRHKTKKWRFRLGFPLFTICHVALLVHFSM